MRKILAPCLAALTLMAAAAAASAQTQISGVGWEVSRLQGKERAPFSAVTELRASPELKFTDSLRAIVTLRNPAAKPVEGLVLRYALRLRLLKKGDAPEKAFWAVPFYFEEVRVTKINPSSDRQVKLIRFELAEQLKKLRNTGLVPTGLKAELMISPRLGDDPAAIMREAVIDILPPETAKP